MSRYTKGERQGVIAIVVIAVALTLTGYLLRGCNGEPVAQPEQPEQIEQKLSEQQTSQEGKPDNGKGEIRKTEKGSLGKKNRSDGRKNGRKAKTKTSHAAIEWHARDMLRDTIPS